MTERTYHTKDKTTWPEGPWQTEPDKIQFKDEATGLPCLIVRNHYGALCGYVGISECHPILGTENDLEHLDVHGGVTFAQPCQPGAEDHAICHIPEHGEADAVVWIGFDCAHAGDLIPGRRFILDEAGDEYRDITYVRAECAKLAAQLEWN